MRLRFALVCLTVAGCGRIGFGDSQQIDAGIDAPTPDAALELAFTEGEVVAELASAEIEDDATLTGDLLEVYFASNRPGGVGRADIWRSERASADMPWEDPVNVAALNTDAGQSTLAMSSNGLFLIFGSDVGSGEESNYDVFVAARRGRDEEFGTPVALDAVNTAASDLASWISDDGLSILIHSNRTPGTDGRDFDIYRSSRSSVADPFSTPEPIPTLANPDVTEISATVNETFAILSISDGDHDLYIAPRIGSSLDFGMPIRLANPNTVDIETDPWLSPDMCTLYFSREVGGTNAIHRAECVR